MAVNKVEYVGRVLIDLTQDTVSENNLLSGVVAHDATGRQITGALENVGGLNGQTTVSGQVLQEKDCRWKH